jgi:hypothetical protein
MEGKVVEKNYVGSKSGGKVSSFFSTWHQKKSPHFFFFLLRQPHPSPLPPATPCQALRPDHTIGSNSYQNQSPVKQSGSDCTPTITRCVSV